MRGFALHDGLVRGTCQASHFSFDYCESSPVLIEEELSSLAPAISPNHRKSLEGMLSGRGWRGWGGRSVRCGAARCPPGRSGSPRLSDHPSTSVGGGNEPRGCEAPVCTYGRSYRR